MGPAVGPVTGQQGLWFPSCAEPLSIAGGGVTLAMAASVGPDSLSLRLGRCSSLTQSPCPPEGSIPENLPEGHWDKDTCQPSRSRVGSSTRALREQSNCLTLQPTGVVSWRAGGSIIQWPHVETSQMPVHG